MSKNFKKILVLSLIAIMLVCAAPIANLAGAELFASTADAAETDLRDGDYYYKVVDGNAVITGCYSKSKGNHVIKDYMGATADFAGYQVVAIEANAFENCDKIETIKIPASVTSIGDYAFAGCTALTAIDIPEGVEKIGAYAFKDCSAMTSVKIPNSVTEIGTKAFTGCDAVTDLTIGKIIKDIEVSQLFADSFAGLVNVEILNHAETVAVDGYEFKDCASLETVKLPESVTSISTAAFQNCAKLVSINIPSKLESIGISAFEGCAKLPELTLPATLELIGDKAFKGCSDKTFVDIIIPDSVVKIGTEAFANCTSLETIKLSANITEIAEGLFSGCSALTGVEIPEGVNTINKQAFMNCSALVSLYIPNSVKYINENVIDGCESLTDVYYDAKETYDWVHMYIHETSEGLTALVTAHKWDFAPTPFWTDDFKSVTVTFTCASGGKHQQVITTTDIETVQVDPTCLVDGTRTHTATVEAKNITYNADGTATIIYEPVTVTANITATGDDPKFVDETLTKTGHKWDEPKWTWTKTETGYDVVATFTCANDKATDDEVCTVIEKAIVTSKTTDPKCTVDGKTVYTATAVNPEGVQKQTTKTDTIPQTGHTWNDADDADWEWSEDYKTAKVNAVCAKGCKETLTATVNVTETVYATCTENGHKIHTATVTDDGKAFKDTETEALKKYGHDWSAETSVDGWIWADGLETADVMLSCKRPVDKNNDGVQDVDAKGNPVVCGMINGYCVTNITSVRTEPTCTVDGNAVYTATFTINGETYTDKVTVYATGDDPKFVDETLKATGHSFNGAKWVITENAGVNKNGSMYRLCTKCQNTEAGGIETQVIPMTLKSIVDGDSGIIVEIPAGALPNNAVIVIKKVTNGTAYNRINGVGNVTNSEVYEIVAKVDGKVVQPAAPITIKLPMYYSEEHTGVYFYNSASGKAEQIGYAQSGNSIIIKTSSLGTFGVVEAEDELGFFEKLFDAIASFFERIIAFFENLF